MSGLEVNVSMAFDGFQLELDHRFSFAGITALFGPSGSGKSSLLRIVSGLERAARGKVVFDGEVWQDDHTFVPAHRRAVGYVFQDARLFNHLSVAGNLRFAHRRSRDGAHPITVDEVVRALDLDALLGRRPASLSGGERQRVAVGRALLSRPQLMLMDEPLAAIDQDRKADILPYLERLPDAFGIPVIYVTHAIEEVARLASHMVVLTAGRKVADGPVAQVLERLDLGPSTGRFEAGVVLTGEVIEHDPAFQLSRLDAYGQRMVIPQVEAAPGTRLRLRVRARDVSLATQRPRGISVRNILEGVVAQIAEEANTAYAEVLVDIRGARLRARITRDAVADLGLTEGKAVYALVKSIAFDRRAVSLSAPDAPPAPPVASGPGMSGETRHEHGTRGQDDG